MAVSSQTYEPPEPGAQPILQLRGVDKIFDDFAAVDRINLDIYEREFFTIVGPSGSGKTTMVAHAGRHGQADQWRHPAARRAHQ